MVSDLSEREQYAPLLPHSPPNRSSMSTRLV